MPRYNPYKPTLYINLDGGIVVTDPEKPEVPKLGPYSKKFMGWAVDNFNVRWLTDRSPSEAAQVTKALGLKIDTVPYAGWLDSKSEAINPQENFFWIEGDLHLPDARWLAETGNADRFLSVSPATGVTPVHQKVLKAAVKAYRAPAPAKSLYRSR